MSGRDVKLITYVCTRTLAANAFLGVPVPKTLKGFVHNIRKKEFALRIPAQLENGCPAKGPGDQATKAPWTTDTVAV